MIDKMEHVCHVKIGRRDHKFEWLVGSVYMNCLGREHLEVGVYQRSGLETPG